MADALDVLAEAYTEMGEKDRAVSVATRVREIRQQLVAAGYHSTLARDGASTAAAATTAAASSSSGVSGVSSGGVSPAASLSHNGVSHIGGTRWKAAFQCIRGGTRVKPFPWRQVPLP